LHCHSYTFPDMKQLVWCTLCLRWSRTMRRFPMWWQRWMLSGLQPIRTTPATQCNSFITDLHHNHGGNTTRLGTCPSSSAGKEFWFLGVLPWQTAGEWWCLWLRVPFYGESFLSEEDHRPLFFPKFDHSCWQQWKIKYLLFPATQQFSKKWMFALKS
jgi:hypothetical protein